MRTYLLISVEIWSEHKDNHKVHARRETEVQLPDAPRLANVTDTAQRAAANMVETLKVYLDNPIKTSDNTPSTPEDL